MLGRNKQHLGNMLGRARYAREPKFSSAKLALDMGYRSWRNLGPQTAAALKRKRTFGPNQPLVVTRITSLLCTGWDSADELQIGTYTVTTRYSSRLFFLLRFIS